MPLEVSLHINNVRIDDIDYLRIVEDVHISSEISSDIVDELIKSSITALDEINVHDESISDVHDEIVESSNTLI